MIILGVTLDRRTIFYSLTKILIGSQLARFYPFFLLSNLEQSCCPDDE